MNAVKNALTRKFGPLPAWTWAIIVGVALYFIRNRAGAGAGGTDTSGAAGTLPYFGPYGESYYPLPGGAGATTGGGGSETGGSAGSGGGSGNGGSPQPQPITINIPGGDKPGGGGDGNNGKPGTGKHPKRHPKPKKPKGAPKGSEHTGTHKPGKGWRGIGGGWWAPPKHRKPRGGAGKSHNPGRTKGDDSFTGTVGGKPTGGAGLGAGKPTGGAGIYGKQRATHNTNRKHAPVRQTSAPKAGAGKRRR